MPVDVNAVAVGSGGPGMAGTAVGACDILNLLGNRLRAVAGLLGPSSPLETLLGQLDDLLDQLLGAQSGAQQ